VDRRLVVGPSGAELPESGLASWFLPAFPQARDRKRAFVFEGYAVGLFSLAALDPFIKAVDGNETAARLIRVGEAPFFGRRFRRER